MKIYFPNPDEFVNDIPGFLDQLELCVYHARKASEKILAKYSKENIEEGNDTPWISFRIPAFDEVESVLSKTLIKADPDRSIEKEIVLSIEEA